MNELERRLSQLNLEELRAKRAVRRNEPFDLQVLADRMRVIVEALDKLVAQGHNTMPKEELARIIKEVVHPTPTGPTLTKDASWMGNR